MYTCKTMIKQYKYNKIFLPFNLAMDKNLIQGVRFLGNVIGSIVSCCWKKLFVLCQNDTSMQNKQTINGYQVYTREGIVDIICLSTMYPNQFMQWWLFARHKSFTKYFLNTRARSQCFCTITTKNKYLLTLERKS